jgi:hypothetical protein
MVPSHAPTEQRSSSIQGGRIKPVIERGVALAGAKRAFKDCKRIEEDGTGSGY